MATKRKSLASRAASAAWKAAAAAPAAALAACPPAFADMSSDIKSNSTLSNVLGGAQTVIQIFGGGLVVWGAVKLGLAIREQNGGASIAEAIATIGGGAIIFAAGTLFSQIAR